MATFNTAFGALPSVKTLTGREPGRARMRQAPDQQAQDGTEYGGSQQLQAQMQAQREAQQRQGGAGMGGTGGATFADLQKQGRARPAPAPFDGRVPGALPPQGAEMESLDARLRQTLGVAPTGAAGTQVAPAESAPQAAFAAAPSTLPPSSALTNQVASALGVGTPFGTTAVDDNNIWWTTTTTQSWFVPTTLPITTTTLAPTTTTPAITTTTPSITTTTPSITTTTPGITTTTPSITTTTPAITTTTPSGPTTTTTRSTTPTTQGSYFDLLANIERIYNRPRTTPQVPGTNTFLQRLLDRLGMLAEGPSPEETAAFEAQRKAGREDLEAKFKGDVQALNEEMAARGLFASTIGSGRMGDLSGQQARALSNLEADILRSMQEAQSKREALIIQGLQTGGATQAEIDTRAAQIQQEERLKGREMDIAEARLLAETQIAAEERDLRFALGQMGQTGTRNEFILKLIDMIGLANIPPDVLAGLVKSLGLPEGFFNGRTTPTPTPTPAPGNTTTSRSPYPTGIDRPGAYVGEIATDSSGQAYRWTGTQWVLHRTSE